MRYIDLDTWKRKDHFNYFRQFSYPQFNICANVDITRYYRYLKEKGLPFFVSVVYAASKAANGVKEFRYRIREDKVVEHDIVSPSYTILTEDETFAFCLTGYVEEYSVFKENALRDIERIKNNPSIEDEPGRDDVLYISSLPWFSFTGVTHPINLDPTESIPRISWGKYFEENGKIQLPVSVQVHHALMDGFHVGQFFIAIQDIMNYPEKHLY